MFDKCNAWTFAFTFVCVGAVSYLVVIYFFQGYQMMPKLGQTQYDNLVAREKVTNFEITTKIRNKTKIQKKSQSVKKNQTNILVNARKLSGCADKKGPLFLKIPRQGGRLGNDMFRYASVLGMARTTGRDMFITQRNALELVFKITHHAEPIKTEGWTSKRQGLYGTFVPTFINALKENCTNITVNGFFQSWKYFDHIKDEIRKEFEFLDSFQREADTILEPIRKNITYKGVLVGVHVRRGDFVKRGGSGYTVARKSYFLKAFDWMREKFKGRPVTFFVTGDDRVWNQENLAVKDVVFMPAASRAVHLCLLANCDHVIMSTGTFSWWAGWLSNGTVVYNADYPRGGSRISRGFRKEDYYVPHWIGLRN